MEIQAVSLLTLVTCCLWSTLSLQGDESVERPNVLFIAMDDLRPAVGAGQVAWA